MHALLTSHDPLLLHGLTQWLSPDFLVAKFGVALFWLGIAILFIECGLFWPFLPGDTLLFAMGLFLVDGRVSIVPGPRVIDILVCLVVYTLAAFAGNVVGYELGSRMGPSIYHRDGRIIRRTYLDQTHAFFERRGRPALVVGRFVPIVRTYITLVAGVTGMERGRFFRWSFVGAVLWVGVLTLLGVFLGGAFPSIGQRIDQITYALLAITVIGLVVELVRNRDKGNPEPTPASNNEPDERLEER